MDSLCHPWFTTTNLSYRFPIFETSATALCGTTRSRHYCAGAPFENWSCHPKEAFFVTTSVSLNTHTHTTKKANVSSLNGVSMILVSCPLNVRRFDLESQNMHMHCSKFLYSRVSTAGKSALNFENLWKVHIWHYLARTPNGLLCAFGFRF